LEICAQTIVALILQNCMLVLTSTLVSLNYLAFFVAECLLTYCHVSSVFRNTACKS